MDYKEKVIALLDSKELSQEQKEKLEEIFFELKESEDEKTKRILHSISSKISFHLCDIFTEEEFQCFDAWSNAWLEKQGEQKPFDYERATIVQQDFAPKAEPKFKIGDWVICQYMHLVMQILNNDNGSYKTVEIDGTERNDSYDFIERNCKLWTIKDAKDGDVLKEDSCIFIIKKMNPNGTAIVHCCLFDDGELDSTGSTLDFDVDSTHPAIKEQCDLLFSEMKEVGYEWDAEKKELKDISKKI